MRCTTGLLFIMLINMSFTVEWSGKALHYKMQICIKQGNSIQMRCTTGLLFIMLINMSFAVEWPGLLAEGESMTQLQTMLPLSLKASHRNCFFFIWLKSFKHKQKLESNEDEETDRFLKATSIWSNILCLCRNPGKQCSLN